MSEVGAGLFVPYMTGGAGFIGIVLAMLARGRPLWVLLWRAAVRVSLALTRPCRSLASTFPPTWCRCCPSSGYAGSGHLPRGTASCPLALGLPYVRATAIELEETGGLEDVGYEGLSARRRVAGDRRLPCLLELRTRRRAALPLLRRARRSQGRPLHLRHRLRLRPCHARAALREADADQGADHPGRAGCRSA